jgi:hypothetical protein
MNWSSNLNDQSKSGGVEVNNKIPNWLLATEFYTIKLLAT